MSVCSGKPCAGKNCNPAGNTKFYKQTVVTKPRPGCKVYFRLSTVCQLPVKRTFSVQRLLPTNLTIRRTFVVWNKCATMLFLSAKTEYNKWRIAIMAGANAKGTILPKRKTCCSWCSYLKNTFIYIHYRESFTQNSTRKKNINISICNLYIHVRAKTLETNFIITCVANIKTWKTH